MQEYINSLALSKIFHLIVLGMMLALGAGCSSTSREEQKAKRQLTTQEIADRYRQQSEGLLEIKPPQPQKP